MSPTILLIFTILGGAFVLLTAYGAVKRDRKLFLYGFCLYSILPVIGESIGYSVDKAPVHVLMVFMFLAQLVLQIPGKNFYGRDNLAAIQIATKVGLAVLIINVGGAVAVFCLNLGVPAQFGYYHVAFVLIMLYVIIIRFTSDLFWVK